MHLHSVQHVDPETSEIVMVSLYEHCWLDPIFIYNGRFYKLILQVILGLLNCQKQFITLSLSPKLFIF